ncbi:unnamed protein product [Mytilus edulis]|uniref:Uncharacterized protein n=1 Tax=Mytilus edulis TaxID=6550 RepID=A0A8S3TBU2_MYTED|nr:unnamed protein product [Mytilus edulis]
MDKYYLRLLGSVSNSRGIDSSIQRTTTSFTCSYPTVQYSRSTEISSSVNRSRDSFDKEGSGGSPCIFNRSRCSHQIAALSGVSHLLEKVGPHSVSGLYFPRRTLPYSSVHSSTSSGKVSESLLKNSSVSISKTVTARQFSQLLGLLNSLADVVPLGRLHIRPLQFYLHQHWLPATQDWEFPVPIIHQELFPHLVWWTSQANVLRGQLLSSPVPNQTLFTDASNLGWGAYLEGLSVSGVWTPEMKAVLLALSHFQSLLQNKSLVLATDNTTVVAYLLKPRGNSLLRAVSFSKRNPSSLQSTSSTDCSSSCPRETQCVSRCSVKNTYSSQYRVGTSTISISGNNTSVGVSPCRPVCNKPQLQNSSVHVSCTRSESLRSGLHECSLGRDVRLRFPTVQISVTSSSEDLSRARVDHSYCSSLAQTSLVSRSSSSVLCSSTGSTIKNFTLERPRQRVLIPSWNLSLVLSALKNHPFEPAEKVEIKFLSYKCCFLLALASGRRRSEIHAFSTADYCLRFNRDKSSVTLLTDPAFLAKNQIPGRGSEPIVIPALPVDSSSKVLCPIRVLLLYLQRTQSLRTSSNSRLFIPINKGKQDLSVKTISSWICKTIQLAYSFSNEELLNSMHIKAHDVRAISTSWALFNNASLEEVLSAGFWRTENSFISHYLQSLATQAQSLYSLGPLVSAQRVVFPPASSGSGDSALC